MNAKDFDKTPEELRKKYWNKGQHPAYPREKWGGGIPYWHWVVLKIKEEQSNPPREP